MIAALVGDSWTHLLTRCEAGGVCLFCWGQIERPQDSTFSRNRRVDLSQLGVWVMGPGKPKRDDLTIIDEPGMAERFQRGLQRALNTPPQHRTTPGSKPGERPASKGRAHKGKTGR